MRFTREFWIWLALFYVGTLAIIAASFLLIAVVVESGDRAALSHMLDENAVVLAYGAAILLFGCGAVLHWLFLRYPLAVRQLSDSTRVLLAANPGRQVAASGAAEVVELAAVINQLSGRIRQSEREFETRSQEARAHVEEERDRFAALMSELSQGVLVSNADGRVLLYNPRAAALLGDTRSASPLGLGRSVFALLDRDQVAHALDKIHQQFARDVERPQTGFVTSAGDTLLRVQVAPFLSGAGNLAGLVFTLDDIGALLGREDQRLKLLQALATGVRAPVANARAAAESLAAFPDMEPDERARFVGIVAAEARVLTERLNAALADYADALKGSLTLEDMRVADLLSVTHRRLAGVTGVSAGVDEIDGDPWVRVDSFAIVEAIVSLATRVADDYGIRNFRLRASESRGFAAIDLVWLGTVVGAEALALWENEPMRFGKEESPLTLKDVLDRHGGEVWTQSDRPRHTEWFRFLLPLGEPVTTALTRPAPIAHRPEYYDFDLFERIETRGELADRRLAELSYTVFDTETTGLEPSAGDEIVSIGAVRIVNGRLLKQEVFEQMVNPRRTIGREARRVHGIDSLALEAEPGIEVVLPRFHRFCEDTVLVAHNAAFDMRFLELKEPAAGVRFAQPVLDTLLLSAVVHASMDKHDLDTIADRLGVRVIGRHTALGDALVAGEVFLRLLPLLAERGIETLGQALEASRATYLARLQY